MKVYHGSNMVIEYPRIQTTGFFKDFGFGFYCTALERQAQRWAANKTPAHIVKVVRLFGYWLNLNTRPIKLHFVQTRHLSR